MISVNEYYFWCVFSLKTSQICACAVGFVFHFSVKVLLNLACVPQTCLKENIHEFKNIILMYKVQEGQIKTARKGNISQSFFWGESKNSSSYAKINRYLEVSCDCQPHLTGTLCRPLLNPRNGPNSVIYCDRIRLREMSASIPY